MNKQDLTRDIKQEVGNLPNMTQIRKYTGFSKDTVRELLRGCDSITDGKQKKYFAGDVAERLLAWR